MYRVGSVRIEDLDSDEDDVSYHGEASSEEGKHSAHPSKKRKIEIEKEETVEIEKKKLSLPSLMIFGLP